MHRPVLVFGVACLVATARVVDLWSTRVITPDLAGEQNVVLSTTGGGWIALIALSVLLVGGTTAMFATAVRLQLLVRPKRRNLHYLSFWRAAIWGRPRPLRDLRWKWPPAKRWLWAVGRFLPWAIIGTSLVAASGNLLAFAWPAFRTWWALMVGNPVSQLLVLTGTIMAVAVGWSHLEHRRYLADPLNSNPFDADPGMREGHAVQTPSQQGRRPRPTGSPPRSRLASRAPQARRARPPAVP